MSNHFDLSTTRHAASVLRVQYLKRFLGRALTLLSIFCALFALGMTAYFMGRLAGALNPTRSYEIPMCTTAATDIRVSPTGYVLGHVPAGSLVWFTKLDLPFAHVAYYSGSAWLEGTITASMLDVCK